MPFAGDVEDKEFAAEDGAVVPVASAMEEATGIDSRLLAWSMPCFWSEIVQASLLKDRS